MLYQLGVVASGRLTFVANDRAGYRVQITSGAPLPTGAWVHVAVTLTGSEARLFVDGVSAAGMPYAIPLSAELTPLIIGASAGPTGLADFYLDRLDELMLYERGLTPAEIARLASGDRPE